jgi:hypothetical protein
MRRYSHPCTARLTELVLRFMRTIVLLLPIMTMASEPSSPEMRRAAVGDLSALPPLLKRGLRRIPRLSANPEARSARLARCASRTGTDFHDFRALRPNRPTWARHVIYLQPLGELAPERSPFIAKLRDFAAVFFAMEVRLRISASFTTRRNPHTSTLQIRTGDVLNFLRSRVPSDAFCILAK